MNWISTKELAEKWEISERRILHLTKEGRIPGAKLVGKSWLYPEDCQKPADKRTSPGKKTQVEKPFHFPLYYYYAYSEYEIETKFTEEERRLYHAQHVYLSGDFKEAYRLLHMLLQSASDLPVRVGTLHTLCMSCLMLGYYSELLTLTAQYKSIFSTSFPYKKELEVTYYDLETFFIGNRYFLKDFTVAGDYEYHPTARNYFFLLSAYTALIKAFSQPDSIMNTSVYVILLQTLEKNSTPLFQTLLSVYLSGMFFLSGDEANGIYYLKKSISCAKSNHLLYQIAFSYKYAYKRFDDVLSLPEFADAVIIKEYSQEFFNHMIGIMRYQNSDSIIAALQPQECYLVYYLLLDLSNTEIADAMNLSLSSVSKKLSVLYQKADVKGRSELLQIIQNRLYKY